MTPQSNTSETHYETNLPHRRRPIEPIPMDTSEVVLMLSMSPSWAYREA